MYLACADGTKDLLKHNVCGRLPYVQGCAQVVRSGVLEHSVCGRLPYVLVVCRWYGQGLPKVVFVERKTHRESWKGEESVKERITLAEKLVLPFLEGKYTIEQAQADLRAKVSTDSKRI